MPLEARQRKHKVTEMAEEIPLVLVAFDLLYADRKDLTGKSYKLRHAELRRIFGRGKGRICLSESVVTESVEAVQTFFGA